MSLDVYLTMDNPNVTSDRNIPVRESGAVKMLTRAEWDERNPGRAPFVVADSENEVYSRNITHNLNDMARAAGLYDAMWQPDEQGWKKAGQLIEPLRAGLSRLELDPPHFKTYNPKNGWGDYDGLVDFAREYLAACIQYPDADVGVSR